MNGLQSADQENCNEDEGLGVELQAKVSQLVTDLQIKMSHVKLFLLRVARGVMEGALHGNSDEDTALGID